MLRSSGHTIAAGLTEGVSISKRERPVCLELYKDNKELGRFMLRSNGHTIAAGLTEGVRIPEGKKSTCLDLDFYVPYRSYYINITFPV